MIRASPHHWDGVGNPIMLSEGLPVKRAKRVWRTHKNVKPWLCVDEALACHHNHMTSHKLLLLPQLLMVPHQLKRHQLINTAL